MPPLVEDGAGSEASPERSRRDAGSSKLGFMSLDRLISVALFAAGLYAYTSTLAPSVLEGDGALFQYTPYVLGVTYPTGFPLYILIGKLWITIFPFGSIAWRMNFLTALCSATALPFIYNATRRYFSTNTGRWAALTATLTFATLPTFWLWSTVTKTYGVNILLFSVVFYLLARAMDRKPATSPLWLPALLLGLQISVHNTAVLLIPGLFLLAGLHFSRYLNRVKAILLHLLLIGLPGLFYLYVPIRAQSLIAHYGRQGAIERGLLADFYQPGWNGLLRYYIAADFTGGVATNWGQVPGQFFSHYLPILADNLTVSVAIIGLIGAVLFAIFQPRLFWPFFLIYAVPIPFVLAYGQGEQSAFLLPSFLIFSLFIAYPLNLMEHLLSIRSTHYALRNVFPLVVFIAYALLYLLPQTRANLNWLKVKWERQIHAEWTDNFNHPLEPGATVLARWGDLTSFWYLQYAEGKRPDLLGLYPPTEATVTDWYERGGQNLYIAGPLESWSTDIEADYQLLPWGRLVRIAPQAVAPQSLLPDLPQRVDTAFDNRLRLLAVDFAPQVVSGRPLPVTMTWQTLSNLPPETTFSLRLTRPEGIITQLDDTLLSGWFPHQSLPAQQYLLSYPLVPVPLGTLPGTYRLQLVVYTSYKQPWPMPDGQTVLDLGPVEVTLPEPTFQPDDEGFNTVAGHDFNGELYLADYDYSVTRVGQGKGFAVHLLWRAIDPPVDNYTLLVELVDAAGTVIRAVEHLPTGGKVLTGQWQAGQFIRDQVDLVLPASAPVGEDALRVRLSWRRPDGSRLNLRRWRIPVGDYLALDWLRVTEKADRTFEIPPIAHPVEANFENKARLLGFNQKGDPAANLEFSQADCTARSQSCQLSLDVFWQGISEMDQLYFVFLHLVDEQGNLVAQHDRAPGIRGKQPTTGWLPDEVITDPINFLLPPDLAPGQYTLRTGLYLPPTGPRLQVVDPAQQPAGDFVELGPVVIGP